MCECVWVGVVSCSGLGWLGFFASTLLRPATCNCGRNIILLFIIAAAKFQVTKFRTLPHSGNGNGPLPLLWPQLRLLLPLFITMRVLAAEANGMMGTRSHIGAPWPARQQTMRILTNQNMVFSVQIDVLFCGFVRFMRPKIWQKRLLFWLKESAVTSLIGSFHIYKDKKKYSFPS
jgi:hypothetical protein